MNDTEHEKAINKIEQYLKENQDFHLTEEPLRHKYHKTFTGLWVSAETVEKGFFFSVLHQDNPGSYFLPNIFT